MIVFELLIDWDGTTRSTEGTEGLFSTRIKAEKRRDELFKEHYSDKWGPSIPEKFNAWHIAERKVQ